MNAKKSQRVREAAEDCTATEAAGWTVVLDDRELRPGVMFADMELIGIPYRLVVGERNAGRGPDRIPGPPRPGGPEDRTGGLIDFLRERSSTGS
jgi:prolyl-tRNA synthetase